MASNPNKLREMVLQISKFLIFLGIGILLFWLVYRGQPIDEIISALGKANYFWIAISLIISLSAHLSRALRWNILIESLGYKPKTLNTFFAVMIMYLANTAIPRSGEITRCGIVKKYENIPFTKLLGTVVIERIIDFIMLFVLMAIVLLTQFDVFIEFAKNNPGMGEKFGSILTINNLIFLVILAALSLIAVLVFRNKMKNTAIYRKIKEFSLNFIEGIKTVKNLERKWLFIGHSVFIWTIYFVTIYITFWSFEFTSHLTLLTGLTIFVMASIGFVAPSPGGIGTWHFMVIETLVIYGVIRHPDANAYAFAVHGSTTIFLVIIGLISLLLIPLVNKKSDNVTD